MAGILYRVRVLRFALSLSSPCCVNMGPFVEEGCDLTEVVMDNVGNSLESSDLIHLLHTSNKFHIRQ